MAPGGEMFRYPQHFGENVLRHGSHEWLPYSKDEVRLKFSDTNLSFRPGSMVFPSPESYPMFSTVSVRPNPNRSIFSGSPQK